MEITAAEQNIEKRMKRNEDSLRDLWDNKSTNIHIIGVPEGEEREKRPEKIFEEIWLNISLTWERKQSTKSRKHRVPGRIDPGRSTPRHTVIKLTKIKDRDKILKATREE